MFTRNRFGWALALELVASTASTQGHHHSHQTTGGGPCGIASGGLGAVGGAAFGSVLPFYSSISPSGVPYVYVPPLIAIAPGGSFRPWVIRWRPPPSSARVWEWLARCPRRGWTDPRSPPVGKS